MSSCLGPNIVNDGLILYLDATSEKSFRGEPTTNLVTTLSIGSQGGSFILTNSPDGLYNSDNAGGNLGGQVFKLEVTIPGSGNNGGFQSPTDFDLPGGSTYLWLSFNAYLTEVYNGTNGSLYGYVAFKNSGGSEIGTSSWVYFVNGTQEQGWSNNSAYLNKWVKVWSRATVPVGGIGVTRWYIYADFLATGKMYVARLQMEQKDQPTAYVNGTRGTTVATGGGWKDLSNSNNDSTLANTPSWNSGYGGYLDFDGIVDYFYQNTTAFDRVNGDPMTVCIFMKPARNGTGYQYMVAARDAGFTWMLYQHTNDGSIQFHGAGQYKSSYVPTLNTWVHIAVALGSNGTYYLYANGELQQTVTGFLYGGTPSNRLGIGAYAGGVEPYQGSISSVQIYNRALSQSEVQQNFNSQKSRFGL
jgi:hypothetical protein